MTHGDDEGTLGEVGDGPEPANLTKMAGGSEVEDDGDGGDAGLPEGRGSVGRKEGVEAEPLSASARLGVAGGHGYGDDDGELRSVAGGETEERGGGRSRERGRSERGSGLRGVAGGTREGGGSQAGRRWPPRPRACEHAAAPTGKRKTTGGE